jgi:hypothetical protein
MNFFLGDKHEIAVEARSIHLNKSNGLMGYAIIWVGGNFFGTIYDLIYMDGYLLSGFYQIDKVPILLEADSLKNKQAIFKYLRGRLRDENDFKIHKHLVSFGTLTDMFTVFAYKNGEHITICWKISRDMILPGFKDLANYPTTPFLYTMKYSLYKEFIERLERILKVWYLEPSPSVI